MENNLENLNKNKHFPDTVGSLKIFGLVLLCMLLFAPVLLLFDHLFGRDVGFGVYYLFAMGVSVYYLHRKRLFAVCLFLLKKLMGCEKKR